MKTIDSKVPKKLEPVWKTTLRWVFFLPASMLTVPLVWIIAPWFISIPFRSCVTSGQGEWVHSIGPFGGERTWMPDDMMYTDSVLGLFTYAALAWVTVWAVLYVSAAVCPSKKVGMWGASVLTMVCGVISFVIVVDNWGGPSVLTSCSGVVFSLGLIILPPIMTMVKIQEMG